jgi:hypothetical protein
MFWKQVRRNTMTFRLKPLAAAISLMGLLGSNVAVAETDWIKGVSVDGVLKVLAGYSRSYNDEDSSDIIVHTAVLGINAQLNQWASGRFSYKYEEGKTDLSVDDGYITLGDHSNGLPAYLRMGSMVVPFGKFTSHMNSDPLTLVLAESAEKAVQVGFNAQGAYGSVFAYNGTTQEDSNDTIDHYGANVGFNRNFGQFGVDVGVSYISDLGDTGNVSKVVEINYLVGNIKDWSNYDYVDAIGAHLIVSAGPVRFIAEYISALDEFQPGQLGAKRAEPKAWNAELGFNFPMGGRKLTFALGYQATEEAWYIIEPRATHLPETRILGTIAMELYENTTVSIEYARSEDYESGDYATATGDDSDSANVVLAVKF